MKEFDIDKFVEKINSINVDKSDENWRKKFDKEFDQEISENDMKKFIELVKVMSDEEFNKKISDVDGTRFGKIISKVSVKDFIQIIEKLDGVEILRGDDKEKFINDYLEKMQRLANRKNRNIDIDFLRENLERNVKYIVNVTLTDEEKEIELKSLQRKREIGAAPGHYC